MTDQHPKRPSDPNQLAKSVIDRMTGKQPSPVQEVTGKNSTEVPNMTQRTVLQCLSLDDWKIVAHLPIPLGEMMLSRMYDCGWIEIRGGEKHITAIRLTPAGLKSMRLVKPSTSRSRSD